MPDALWLLQKKSHGNVLLEQVFYHLDILEKDYFGLQYTDHYNVNVSSLYVRIHVCVHAYSDILYKFTISDFTAQPSSY